MRVERALVGLFFIASTIATGCGRLAYNLPPSNRLMEPGPGVGGPGPGVIPPAGSPYGIYGGGVNRFPAGAAGMGGTGGPMGGGMGPCAPSGPGGPCGPGGPGCPCESSMPSAAARSGVMQASFHHAMDGGRFGGCMRPGTMEAYCDGAGGAGVGIATSQIAFLGDDGVQVTWDVNGAGMFDSVPLVIPGRQDFYQGAIYRLKLTNLPGRAGVTLYPTLEVAPVTPRTDAYLAHSPIPVQFTEEDFDQVTSGNFVTKVIYLPDPEFQELALAGVETLVSTRLDPGVDPIAEADRRGSILAIVRIGNKDIELGSGASRPQTRSVVPAFQQGSQNGRAGAGSATQTSFQPRGDGAQAQYCEQGCPCDGGQMCEGGPNCEGGPMCQCGPMCRGGSMYQGGPMYDGGGNMGCGPGGGSMPNMPVGMPTGFNGPPAVPPNMIAGAPQWGMPITGTPIGLPGPPHVPLGIPAGLQQHVMKNKTRVMIPPPVTKMVERVKQRPGLNYPRPDDHVCVDETQREPIRLFPAWLNPFHHHGGAGGGAGGGGGADCGPCPQ